MPQYRTGDIVSFRLLNDLYILGKLLKHEKLALHDHYHVAIYDTLLEAGPPGPDMHGESVARSHALPDRGGLPFVVDHLALSESAFLGSDPIVFAHEEVSDEEMRGYTLWLHMKYRNAVQSGTMREFASVEQDEENEGDFDEESEFTLHDEDERETDMDVEEESLESDGISPEEEHGDDDGNILKLPVHTWHLRVFDVPVGNVLVELNEVFADSELADTTVGKFLTEQFGAANAGAIEELVDQLMEGDYGAGHELLNYGAAAADTLYKRLQGSLTQEQIDDLLDILGQLGNERAYQHICELFSDNIDRLNTPLGLSAVRAYCYAVMLTGGATEPLHKYLHLLPHITHPDLLDDVQSAMNAIEEMPEGEPVEPTTSTSLDPLGNL